jgi:hypothetical protein
MRARLGIVLTLLFAVVLGSCDGPQFAFGPNHAGFNAQGFTQRTIWYRSGSSSPTAACTPTKLRTVPQLPDCPRAIGVDGVQRSNP